MSMEQLFDQIGHDLGWHDHNMRRDRPYNGQPHTCTGTRGATEIRGVTFRDLRDCFVRAVLLSTGAEVIDGVDMRPRYEEANKGEAAALCESDLYGFNLDKLDPMAIAQNLACEVERVMGIFGDAAWNKNREHAAMGIRKNPRKRKIMSEKLKPCPFCGSESAPKIIVYYKSAYVSCDIDDGGCGAEFDSRPGEHAAIAAWNKRADQAK